MHEGSDKLNTCNMLISINGTQLWFANVGPPIDTVSCQIHGGNAASPSSSSTSIRLAFGKSAPNFPASYFSSHVSCVPLLSRPPRHHHQHVCQQNLMPALFLAIVPHVSAICSRYQLQIPYIYNKSKRNMKEMQLLASRWTSGF